MPTPHSRRTLGEGTIYQTVKHVVPQQPVTIGEALAGWSIVLVDSDTLEPVSPAVTLTP